MNIRCLIVASFFSLMPAGAVHADALVKDFSGLQMLSEEAMDDVSAQAGIAINLEYRINAAADGSAIPCVAVAQASDCRLAFNFADRAGSWVVLKDYRGLMKLTKVNIDVSSLASADTVHRDLSRMGTYNPNGKPAIQLAMSDWSIARATSAVALASYLNGADYDDFTMFINTSSVGAEFDNGATPGFMRNQVTGAPISLRMVNHDLANANAPAQIRLDGRLQLSGY